MSATFLLALSALPHDGRGEVIDGKQTARRTGQVRQVATERVAALPAEALAAALGDLEGQPPLQAAQEAVTQFLDRALADPSDDEAPRFWESECDQRVIRGVPYVLSGESSWGDEPEGDWRLIDVVGCLGVFDEAIPSSSQLRCPHDDEDLVLTERGYVRTWSTQVDRDRFRIRALYSGRDDWSETGDGKEFLECSACRARLPIPEGYTIAWT